MMINSVGGGAAATHTLAAAFAPLAAAFAPLAASPAGEYAVVTPPPAGVSPAAPSTTRGGLHAGLRAGSTPGFGRASRR
jgi:hypothetical protein